ncbi:MAG: NAD(P)H-binding protein, partial [Planctomycetota bacterium]
MTRNRTCVIFGGSGFVGRAIIGQLREMGFRIVVPTRNRELVRGLTVVPEVRVVTADIYDPATLRRLLEDADVAINLVGILNEKGHHRGRGFYTAHRDLTGAIVAACADAGVPRFLQMSALKANAKDGPSDYLKSKGEAEALVRKAPDGVAWTIFQPSVVFGPEDSFINRFAQLLKLAPV